MTPLRDELADAKPGQVLRKIMLAHLSVRAKVLLAVLWCRADWRTGHLPRNFGQHRLMQDTGIKRRGTLYQVRDELMVLGLLDFEPARRGRPTAYSFPWYEPGNSGVRTPDT